MNISGDGNIITSNVTGASCGDILLNVFFWKSDDKPQRSIKRRRIVTFHAYFATSSLAFWTAEEALSV